MSETVGINTSLRGSELVCAPTDIPVERVLGLKSVLLTYTSGIVGTRMIQDNPRREGMSVHYETIPLADRDPAYLFADPDGEVDQSTHLTYQLRYLDKRSRLAVVLQQYSTWPRRSPATRQHFAFEWNAGDELVAGARRDSVLSATDGSDRQPRFTPVDVADDASMIIEQDTLLVETSQRPASLGDIDELEGRVTMFAQLKAQQPPRRLP